MRSFVHASLRFRALVLALAAGALVVGGLQLRNAPVDTLPEFTPPYAEVQTEALGLSANEVEQLITVPLEADLLNGVENVEVIRSRSLPGLSSVVMVFGPGTDVYRGRQLIEERLAQAHALPNVSKPPTLLPPLSSANRVLMIELSSDKLGDIEQSVIARWTMRPRLMGVPGVANVSIWGLRDQQLQVQVDPQRLRARGVTLNQVIESAGNAQVVSPLSFLEASTPGTGGFIETPQQRLQVRHLVEVIGDPQALGRVPGAGTNGRLQLSDVATITVNHQPLIGDAVVNGGHGLMLVVEKFPGASTLAVSEAVEDALEDLRPGLTGVQTSTSLFRPADYLEQALDNLWLTFGLGLLLLLLLLAALRLHWRALVVAVVSVPLSLVVAGLLLTWFGQSLNLLVLLGLAAALTVVVDEAVTPAHRVLARLRRRRGSLKDDTVELATLGVRTPLVYASLVAALVAVPVLAMGGRPGAFVAPMAWAYLAAIGGATLVAVTVSPVLSAVLAARWHPSGERPPGKLAHRYSHLLSRMTASWRVPLAAAGALLVVGLSALPFLDRALVPQVQDRALRVRLVGEPGTSNPRMTAIATQLGDRLEALPGVAEVGAHVGRAVTGDRVADVNSSDVWVRIAQDADHDRTLRAIERTVAGLRDVDGQVLTSTESTIRDAGALVGGENRSTGQGFDVLTGAGAPLTVRVFGEDLAVLREQAAKVRDVVAGVSGVVDPRVRLPEQQPTITIEVDLDRAQQYGITPGAVRRAGATLIQGIQVGSVFQEQKVFDVVVQGVPSTRSSVEAVRGLLVDLPDGGHVTLGQVSDVRVADEPSAIQRDAVSRRLDVEAGVAGRSLAAVTKDVERALARTTFPLEYHAEVLPVGTASEIGVGRVAGFAGAAVVAVFLLLHAAFRSWRLAALTAAALPLPLAGGLLAAVLGGRVLSLATVAGLVVTFTLTARCLLVLVDDVLTIERDEPDTWHATAVRRAAQDRLAPTLLTAVGLLALLAPVLLLGPRPGTELLHAVAVTALGGVPASVLVTGLVFPAVYARFDGLRRAAEWDEDRLKMVDLSQPTFPHGADADGSRVPATGRSQRKDLEARP
jgi:Cu/Ag efflux pump CusA